ncbi:MAG: hypothetical protein FJ044_03405 [Candidatus Cloacimonetes bacterium]|nr:hypothetical protein [Candidatus Cloacimonadota bacterium]
MNNQTYQPINSPNELSFPPFTPLAKSFGSRIEAFPENQALQFDGHPRLVPIISNQRVNRVLSRFPVNIPTRFVPPSAPRGEKVFQPSTKMRERLQSLQRNLAQVYRPKKETEKKGEIPLIVSVPGGPPAPSPPRDEVLWGLPTDETQKLRKQLAQKEQELTKEKSRQQAVSKMVKTYQTQIQSLAQKKDGLGAEISLAEEKLAQLSQEVKSLRQKVSREKPSYQKKEGSVSELRNSLSYSQQVITELKEKINQKEKTLQKILVESQEEREKAGKAIAEKEAAEALVKNLRVALQNAKEERERAKSQAVSPQQLQVKEEQIKKLFQRLQEKEKEAQTARQSAEKAQKVLAEEENIRKEIADYQEQVGKLQTQNQTLTTNLQNEEKRLAELRETVGKLAAENKQKEEELIKKDRFLENLRRQKEKLAAFADELSSKLGEATAEKHLQTIVEAEIGKKAIKKPVTKIVPRKAEEVLTKPLTSLVNAVNGIVMTSDGKLLQNAVVIIRDKNNTPLRALRTNELGQFVVATPLPNNIYHIEVEKEGEKFDILEVELTGEVLAPIEIKAK